MLHKDLIERERAGKPINVGLVGAGQMGEGLIAQMEMMNGMQAAAVADVVPGRANETLKSAGVPAESIVETTGSRHCQPGTSRWHACFIHRCQHHRQGCRSRRCS